MKKTQAEKDMIEVDHLLTRLILVLDKLGLDNEVNQVIMLKIDLSNRRMSEG